MKEGKGQKKAKKKSEIRRRRKRERGKELLNMITKNDKCGKAIVLVIIV